MLFVSSFWLALQLNYVYFRRFCASYVGWHAIHWTTVHYYPLCLSGLYTVEKLNKCMLRELMKMSDLECWISMLVLFYLAVLFIFEIIQINHNSWKKTPFYISGRIISIMFNFRSGSLIYCSDLLIFCKNEILYTYSS